MNVNSCESVGNSVSIYTSLTARELHGETEATISVNRGALPASFLQISGAFALNLSQALGAVHTRQYLVIEPLNPLVRTLPLRTEPQPLAPTIALLAPCLRIMQHGMLIQLCR